MALHFALCFFFSQSQHLLALTGLVEVDDDLVEESDALDSLVNVLGVELGEVWNARKQNSRIGSGNSC